MSRPDALRIDGHVTGLTLGSVNSEMVHHRISRLDGDEDRISAIRGDVGFIQDALDEGGRCGFVPVSEDSMQFSTGRNHIRTLAKENVGPVLHVLFGEKDAAFVQAILERGGAVELQPNGQRHRA